MNKHQHIIDTLLESNKIHTVSKPKSNWRYKVYPKPRIWITKDTLKEKKFNKLIKKRNHENSI